MSKKKKKKSSPPQKNNSAKAAKAARDDRNFTIFCVVLCVCVLVVALIAILPRNTKEAPPSTPNVDALEKNQRYYATIEIYDYGTIVVELDHTEAPITVKNFVTLAKSGFYDGLTFHRIIEGFMMQGGAPATEKDKAANIIGEFSDNGYENGITHKRGVISMARADDYNSANSQFFIMQNTKTHLDGKYAAFGHVVEGLEVVDAICEAAEPTDDNGSISLFEQPVIESITISVETVS